MLCTKTRQRKTIYILKPGASRARSTKTKLGAVIGDRSNRRSMYETGVYLKNFRYCIVVLGAVVARFEIFNHASCECLGNSTNRVSANIVFLNYLLNMFYHDLLCLELQMSQLIFVSDKISSE